MAITRCKFTIKRSCSRKEEAIILSKKEDERLVGPKLNFYDFMRHSPLKGLDIDLEREQSRERSIDL